MIILYQRVYFGRRTDMQCMFDKNKYRNKSKMSV